MPYDGACRFAISRQITTSPERVPVAYDSTFGVYDFLRSDSFNCFARARPTNASEMSQAGSTAAHAC